MKLMKVIYTLKNTMNKEFQHSMESKIDLSDDSENADDSIRVNREFDSNEIDKSDLQFEKHDEQRISTLDGITIDLSDKYENTFDSIRVNYEFDSNEINESD
jgi:hypothetical protein